MHIIVGLGNPGSQYAHTHHNAGFDVVEMLAQRLGVSFGKLKCKAMLAEARIGAERVVLAQPQTFMNLSGESVVLLNPALDVDMKYRRKQMTQLSSKMRFTAAQFEAYLATGVWRRNAEHSNRMAQLLTSHLSPFTSHLKIMYPVQVNSVFAQLPADVWHRLQEEYFFYDWDEANDVVRWMCSFDTTEEDIRAFVAALRRLL